MKLYLRTPKHFNFHVIFACGKIFFWFKYVKTILGLLLFSCSVMSNSLWPCPSPTPGACSNSCPLSQWCHRTISFSVVPFSSCLQSFPASGSFLMSWLFTSGGKDFGVSASGLFSFRIDWFDLLAVQGTLKGLLQHHSPKASILWLSAFFDPTVTSIHDYWKNHSFDKMDLCWQSNVSAF